MPLVVWVQAAFLVVVRLAALVVWVQAAFLAVRLAVLLVLVEQVKGMVSPQGGQLAVLLVLAVRLA